MQEKWSAEVRAWTWEQEAWVPVFTLLHTCCVAMGRLSNGCLRLGFSICKMEL